MRTTKIESDIVRGVALTQAIEDAWPNEASFIASIASINSFNVLRDVQRRDGIIKLTAIFDASSISQAEGIKIDRLTLASRIEMPVPDVPEIEQAFLYYRYLIKLSRHHENEEMTYAETFADGLSVIFDGIGRSATDTNIDIAAWSVAVEDAWLAACRKDPLGMLPSHRIRHALKVCHDMASIFDRWQTVMGCCAALGLLRHTTFYLNDNTQHLLPYGELVHSKHKQLLNKAITRRAQSISHALGTSTTLLVGYGDRRREGSFYNAFASWAQTHFTYSDNDISRALGCSRRTASRMLAGLCAQNMLTEHTGRDRSRLYAAPSIHHLLLR